MIAVWIGIDCEPRSWRRLLHPPPGGSAVPWQGWMRQTRRCLRSTTATSRYLMVGSDGRLDGREEQGEVVSRKGQRFVHRLILSQVYPGMRYPTRIIIAIPIFCCVYCCAVRGMVRSVRWNFFFGVSMCLDVNLDKLSIWSYVTSCVFRHVVCVLSSATASPFVIY